jgi:ketosteroid isomerase-like protein
MHGAEDGRGREFADDGELRWRVHELVRLRMASDVNEILPLFVEDVELRYNCSKVGLFPAGCWRGHDALRDNLRRTDIDYEPLDAEVQDLLVEGDRTAVRWTSRWRHRGTGRIYPMDMAHFLRWRNGQIVEMNEFIDHHAVSHTTTAVTLFHSFDAMLSPPSPGLSRDEMAERLMQIGNFSREGPDIGLFQRYCDPEVVNEFVGDRTTIFYAGRHRGIDALVNIIRAINVDFEQIGSATPEMVVEDGRVAARRTVEWRHRGTGRRGLVELADFVRFENGLIVEVVEFRDSVALLQMQD